MIWFTSDIHFWHANVIRYCNRPFSSVEEMNDALINNWNKVVAPNDTVYCLGDFSLAFRPVEAYSSILNGTKYLVPGNHDFCHSYHKKSRSKENRDRWIKKYEDHGWIVLPEQTTLSVTDSIEVNMCHLPYEFVHTEHDDKYERWRPKDDGKWLICGHVHEKWKLKGKMINVGVDQWNYTPVSIEDILKIICAQTSEK